MGEIISIDPKLAEAREAQALRRQRRKIRAIRKVLRCTRCGMKCEKCGTSIEPLAGGDGARPHIRDAAYRLCPSCREEYEDYRKKIAGQGKADCYWHNAHWEAAWGRWIEYQAAMDRYLKSDEFQRLIREIRQGADS